MRSTDDRVHIVAAVIANDRGEVLLVRKQSASVFIQPGGKIEPGEEPLAALARELDEELGVGAHPSSIAWLGEFSAPAVHEQGCRVVAQAYSCRISGVPRPLAEIAELRWIDPAGSHPVPVAPLSALHILPAYRASRSA